MAKTTGRIPLWIIGTVTGTFLFLITGKRKNSMGLP